MALTVDSFDETAMLKTDDVALVKELLLAAAAREQLDGETEVSVTFVDNDGIRALNREYRQIDEATDVISFPLADKGEDEMDAVVPRLLGDIVISVPKARMQAKAFGHSFQRELGFLAVHGFLHLLGYDHLTEADEKKMFSKQKDILHEFGLPR